MSSSDASTDRRTVSKASIVLAFGCVYIFWGSTYAAIRIGGQTMPAMLLAGVRFLIAGSILLAWCRWRGYGILPPRRTLGMLTLIGILLLGGGNVGLIVAEKAVPSGLASLFYAVTPLYVALAERFLPGGEPISRRGWIGLLLGFAGLVAMFVPSLHTGLHGNPLLLGSLAALLGGTISWAAGSLVSRHARLKVNIFVAAAWQMILGGIFDTFCGTLAGEWPAFHPNSAGMVSMIYLVTGGSLIGYTGFIYLLEHVPVAKVMSYTYVNPVVAVLLGIAFLGERLVSSEYVGMVAILVAVFLLTTAQVGTRPTAGEPRAELE
jgi:drug/metabolite transporter (DMT)-like permease